MITIQPLKVTYWTTKMFEDVKLNQNPSLLIPACSWLLTLIQGLLTWIIVRYTLSKVSARRTVLDLSNIAVVTSFFLKSVIASVVNTLVSLTSNAGCAISTSVGLTVFVIANLFFLELIANSAIQTCLIANPCTLYSPTFSKISKSIVRFGIPAASLMIGILFHVFAGSEYIVTAHLKGQLMLPLVEDIWTIYLLTLALGTALTLVTTRVYLHTLRKKLKLPSENNIFTNQSLVLACLIGFGFIAVNIFIRIRIEPGQHTIIANAARSLVVMGIVYTSENIWKYTCDLPLCNLLVKSLKMRLIRRVDVDVKTDFQSC